MQVNPPLPAPSNAQKHCPERRGPEAPVRPLESPGRHCGARGAASLRQVALPPPVSELQTGQAATLHPSGDRGEQLQDPARAGGNKTEQGATQPQQVRPHCGGRAAARAVPSHGSARGSGGEGHGRGEGISAGARTRSGAAPLRLRGLAGAGRGGAARHGGRDAPGSAQPPGALRGGPRLTLLGARRGRRRATAVRQGPPLRRRAGGRAAPGLAAGAVVSRGAEAWRQLAGESAARARQAVAGAASAARCGPRRALWQAAAVLVPWAGSV